VDDWRTRFIIFLFADPHLLEGWQRGQDRTSDPYRVLPLWWCNDFDFHCGRCQGSDFLLHTVSNTRVHCGAARHNNITVQIFPDVNIAFHDGVVGSFVDTSSFHSQERGLEEGFRTPKSFQQWWLDRRVIRSSSQGMKRMQRWPFLVQSQGRHSKASLWCLWQFLSRL